jgi:large subunit ribosomal protein L10
MNREQKAVVIEEIAANIKDSQAIFAVDFRGTTVPQAAELRDKLRAVDASFRVVKNSLTERAADQAGVVELKELLAGPTALTFVRGDAATAAKAIADYARITQRLAFKGGVMDGVTLTPDQVSAISRLLSRQALYGQLVGLVASPLTGLVRTLGALVGGLAIQLGAILEKKESGEIPAGDPPAAAAPPAVEEPAAAVEEPAAVETPAAVAGSAAVEEPAVVAEPAAGEEPAAVETPASVAEPAAVEEPAASGEAPAEPASPQTPDTPATDEPPAPVADPPVAEPPHPAEPASTDEAGSPPATAAPQDSGEEVAAAESAQAAEAPAEEVPAGAAPATDEPSSTKENH